jgi:hypothetical protein
MNYFSGPGLARNRGPPLKAATVPAISARNGNFLRVFLWVVVAKRRGKRIELNTEEHPSGAKALSSFSAMFGTSKLVPFQSFSTLNLVLF